ncbi:PREDICTED: glucose-dependent insulinotropic receptor [Gavialis gangeticus]|uniref:glucose-dependent insulinotropic receptor n=1 Tax=Gavialis gangeticus TaxID=94835 RepID=UPI00092E956C|nr:PREDICTED: glucose-dependent insulinotropic receptor [Gavialis gangeticus]
MPDLLYGVLHSLLSCFIPAANLLVIVVVYKLMKKKRGTNYIFILNLAFADLLVGVMCIAEALDDMLDGNFDRNLSFCLLRICMSLTPCIGSILTLLLISLDRYLAVKLPLHYPALLNKIPIVFSLTILWAISFLFGHMPLIFPSLQKSNYTGYCGLLYAAKSEYLYAICFGIFIPVLLILICLHVSVGRIAYSQHKRILRSCLQAEPLRAHLRHFKALRTALIVIICFTLSWGPYYMVGIVQAICESCNLAELLKDILFLLGELNSLINPIIYALYSKDIRSHLAKLMKCKKKGQANPLAVIHFNIQASGGLNNQEGKGSGSSGDQASDVTFPSCSGNCKIVYSVS